MTLAVSGTSAVGVSFAIATCALWAFSFVSPIVLGSFSPYVVTLGRYAVFGLVSLVLVPLALKQLRALRATDWLRATWLSIVGNMVYYLFLAAGIQLCDVPGPTVVMGLLPLTVPIFANVRNRELPWGTLRVPLIGIATGLFLVNAHEYQSLRISHGIFGYVLGISFAVAALACWTWYGVSNAVWLRTRSTITATAWTIAQGVTLLPIVVVAGAVTIGLGIERTTIELTPEDWHRFLIVSIVVGFGSSWLATLCWSQASRLLPTTIAGQLIVFVSVAAVIYGSVYRGTPPSLAVALGVFILVVSVVLGVRTMQRHTKSPQR